MQEGTPPNQGLSAATKPGQEQVEEEALVSGTSRFPPAAAPATLDFWGGNLQLMVQVGSL